MSCFLRWVTATHTMRYYAHHHTSGDGHLYQGRCKSLPIQDDGHFVTVCRYVERVHQPLAESELAAVRRCVPRGTPFGETDGRDVAADRLGLAAFLPGLQPTPRVRASGVLSFPPATRRLATSRPSLRILWPFRASAAQLASDRFSAPNSRALCLTEPFGLTGWLSSDPGSNHSRSGQFTCFPGFHSHRLAELDLPSRLLLTARQVGTLIPRWQNRNARPRRAYRRLVSSAVLVDALIEYNHQSRLYRSRVIGARRSRRDSLRQCPKSAASLGSLFGCT